ncbi:putative glutamine amidotransferase GAT1_2.1 [Dendrobium catenatum]|uniref:Uncharacterized protein n=1 Tax=Dendrobium catenatum TaxID=906689 RepID=A0A2I0XBU0_9ASPA|nr:putative glutamine amidotransferase GAT1_2.1 [Dendrobium catenatum]PKU85371.1 hypothetical protein MA16_Dca003110 [Dendrobium catenatum]
MASSDLSTILPRVVIVSRRCVRKNKFVDFVGEYHLDLIIRYGAVPVIVPRVAGVHLLLESFEPIHGVLLCEGEDIDPSHYSSDQTDFLSPSELDEIRLTHSSDATTDPSKDSIELRLSRLCLSRGIPFLGICRGSQILNIACRGTLYCDVGKQLRRFVEHVDYGNYDGHRHAVEVVEGTPLREWFGEKEIMVNSYHHQGVKRLAERFRVMALAKDGLVEGFYDPEVFDVEKGKFLMGLQFHPERMRKNGSDEFDYPGCPRAYQEFVKAVIAYQKKVNGNINPKVGSSSPKLDQEMEEKRKVIVRSFSIAKDLYDGRHDLPISKQSDLEPGADFLESNTALSVQQEKRLKQMGATVRNSTSYLQMLKKKQERETMARNIMSKMSVVQLSELLSFYNMMGVVCTEVLERKIAFDQLKNTPGDGFYY